jgi:Flp pilus assembly pilin Flp
MVKIHEFIFEVSGATATEYCLLVSLIALGVAATLSFFGTTVLGLFTFGKIADTIANAS